MRQNLLYFAPELVLCGTIVALFLADFFTRGQKRLFAVLALLGFSLMLAVAIGLRHLPPAHFFSGMVTFDPLGSFFKYLFGLVGILAVVFSARSPELEKADTPSYYTLLVALTLGMILLATASHLLMIYLALEMVSVLSYILTGYLRGVRRSAEAGLKYVIYGGVASGIMAYGLSILYGLTGTMDLSSIATFLASNPVNRPLLYVSVLLIMAGFGYKIAAFPFHMWCPDVYEGAPTPFTAFLSVGPKAAGFAALIRFFLTAMTQLQGTDYVDFKATGWPELIAVLSIATMTLGNLTALVQTNIKRLLAYSSIAHAGYLLMGFAALNQESIRAVLFYLAVYALMNLGAFLVVIIIANHLKTEAIEDYRGLGYRGGYGLVLALVMSVFLFSLTGVPPLAGFIGKFYLFGAVVRAGLYTLAVAGVLNSVVSLYYYVRIVKLMFFDRPTDERTLALPLLSHSCVVAGLAILTLYFGLFWNSLAEFTQRSAQLLF